MKAGEPLAVLHANDREKLQAAKKRFLQACTITGEPPAAKPFIRGIVTKEGIQKA